MNPALMAAIFITAAVAAYFDIRQRRIFNWLTLGVAGSGLALRFITSGTAGLLNGAEGWLLGLGLLLIPFAVGAMGGGDVKLLAAFGALGGPAFVAETAIVGSLVGGLVAIAWLAWQRQLLFTLRHFVILLRHPFRGVSKKQAIPFGALLSMGAVGSALLVGAAW